MRRHLITLPVLALSVSLMGSVMCFAQDTGRGGARAAPAQPKSDVHALAVLEVAAAEQGGEALAKPGGLTNFRVEFSRVQVQQAKRQDDGSIVYGTNEASALEIDWMRNEGGKPSSLRTYWKIDGKEITRAVMGDEDYYWLFDGTETTQLQESVHPDDVDEIHLHRRLSETLLDVAVLHKLVGDGSVWRNVDDPLHAGTALHRTPPARSGGLTFTLWIDNDTSIVTHVRVEPIEKAASTLHYELGYMKDRPVVSGADLRFPQHVIVHEQRPTDKEPKKVMELRLKRVFFNTKAVNADTFAPPQVKRDGR